MRSASFVLAVVAWAALASPLLLTAAPVPFGRANGDLLEAAAFCLLIRAT